MQLINHDDWFGALHRATATLHVYCGTFFYCYFGQRLTSAFGEISDSVYGISWYLLPIEMQSILPAMMPMAQRSVYIRGFANIECTHRFYRKVKNHFKFFVGKKFIISLYCSFQLVSAVKTYFLGLRSFSM